MRLSIDQSLRKRQLPLRRRVLYSGICVAAVLACGWMAWRVVLLVRADVPLVGGSDEMRVWQFYYPKLSASHVLTDDDRGRYFDVLLLGGSVLEQVVEPLRVRLEKLVPIGRSLRLYDLTSSAHTTRDSLLKMRLLGERRFDVVIVYHGINDVRMNCCTRDEFRADYSHCDWYSGMSRRVAAGRLTFRGLLLDAAHQLIPLGEPSAEAAMLGRDVKTRVSFENNLREIVQLAQRQTASPARVVLITFGSCIPPGYSRSAFESGQCGFAEGAYRMVVESWGDPTGVALGLVAHNEVVRKVAADSGATLVDMDARLSGQLALFSDVCHLSAAGQDAFVGHLTARLAAAGEFRPSVSQEPAARIVDQ